MHFWTILLASAGLVSLAALAFLFCRFRRFRFVCRLKEKNRVWGVVLPLLMLLLLAGIVFAVLSNVTNKPLNAAIVLIHLLLFWLLFDGIGRLVQGKFVPGRKIYWQGVSALLVTAVYLGFGWYAAHHVVRTDYALSTEKTLPKGKITVAQISDSHVGALLDGAKFGEYVKQIDALSPDLIVLTGDFVDDDTPLSDLLLSCEALGKTNAPVCFVYGNHDRRYFGGGEFDAQTLTDSLKAAGVTVLRDDVVYLEDLNVTLIGRDDASRSANRKSMADLMQSVKEGSYVVVLDHEPNDFDAEAASGADLVLCGHTHGGQLFPLGYVGLLMGANDEFLGLSRRENTDFIVNSGIADWSIPFKTGCRAEYVIVEVTGK